jgi:hypothetical protein
MSTPSPSQNVIDLTNDHDNNDDDIEMFSPSSTTGSSLWSRTIVSSIVPKETKEKERKSH